MRRALDDTERDFSAKEEALSTEVDVRVNRGGEVEGMLRVLAIPQNKGSDFEELSLLFHALRESFSDHYDLYEEHRITTYIRVVVFIKNPEDPGRYRKIGNRLAVGTGPRRAIREPTNEIDMLFTITVGEIVSRLMQHEGLRIDAIHVPLFWSPSSIPPERYREAKRATKKNAPTGRKRKRKARR